MLRLCTSCMCKEQNRPRRPHTMRAAKPLIDMVNRVLIVDEEGRVEDLEIP